MPDYLSRSPVEDATEDPDETFFTASQSTQADHELCNRCHHVVSAVQTRFVKLRQTTTDTSINTTNPIEDSLLFQEENRITPFSIEQLRQTQQHDEYTQNIINNIKKYKKYFISNDLLMHRSNPLVPYVPHGELRRTILRIYHDTAANGAHFGRDKTIHKIKQRYFWSSMYKDIDNYIKSCILCAQYNPRRQKTPVSMDFHGPITPVSRRRNKYIISLTDVLSKFVVTKAVRDNSAQTVVRFLKEDIITKFGTPHCILTDNGTHFTSSVTNELL
ncbi:unnamed protein product, partial [Adineta steineri]